MTVSSGIPPASAGLPCVCTVDDGLVQEWVSKARAVAKAKGFAVAKPSQPSPLPALTADLLAALRDIREAYDRYRGRGVMPAPDEYQNLVRAIETGRVVIARADALSAHQTVAAQPVTSEWLTRLPCGCVWETANPSRGYRCPDHFTIAPEHAAHRSSRGQMPDVDEDAWRRGKVEWS